LRFTYLSGNANPELASIYFGHDGVVPPNIPAVLFRGLHLIRDPRDVILSGVSYHAHSDESWLHQPQPQFGGRSYQQQLNSLDEIGRFRMELERSAATSIDEMRTWNYQDDRFFELKYEGLFEDEDDKLARAALTFLSFDERDMVSALGAFHDHSLRGKLIPADHRHIRSGRPRQWRDQYRRIHGEMFLDQLGDCLLELGYERDHSWVLSLPE
jgi:hypothetical protein